ncbi:7-carboxy-7-deazaguanine synthase QueE [uncultured Hyphomonas sp.]|jgi:organic radical activating enzyme|uniref:7-carboxy-7-deazaguanine synthase QueE n=1 Tax=uncultured Hyphomonas sp. TaxID=225298 RepID=UPI0030DC9001|tara:strand:- start:40434 stop:41189 length:756 start_codon:yes stop_codon:yes gene_type:complete
MRLAVTEPGVPEIFHSLQGEGVSAGKPSVFVRFSQCNLHCVWCDTAYTWNFQGTEFSHRDDLPGAPKKFDRAAETVDVSVEALAERLISQPCRRIIFTGGEPLLQQRDLGELIQRLKAFDPDFYIEIETNGTIKPVGLAAELIDQFNVSPKLAHSGNAASIRLRPEVLGFYAGDPRANFKIVVANPSDLEEVHALVAESGMPASRVWLMPEGRTPAELRAREPWLAEACLEAGYNFTDRLHIHLYGDTRGT